jgi:hypothetical protein
MGTHQREVDPRPTGGAGRLIDERGVIEMTQQQRDRLNTVLSEILDDDQGDDEQA